MEKKQKLILDLHYHDLVLKVRSLDDMLPLLVKRDRKQVSHLYHAIKEVAPASQFYLGGSVLKNSFLDSSSTDYEDIDLVVENRSPDELSSLNSGFYFFDTKNELCNITRNLNQKGAYFDVNPHSHHLQRYELINKRSIHTSKIDLQLRFDIFDVPIPRPNYKDTGYL